MQNAAANAVKCNHQCCGMMCNAVANAMAQHTPILQYKNILVTWRKMLQHNAQCSSTSKEQQRKVLLPNLGTKHNAMAKRVTLQHKEECHGTKSNAVAQRVMLQHEECKKVVAMAMPIHQCTCWLLKKELNRIFIVSLCKSFFCCTKSWFIGTSETISRHCRNVSHGGWNWLIVLFWIFCNIVFKLDTVSVVFMHKNPPIFRMYKYNVGGWTQKTTVWLHQNWTGLYSKLPAYMQLWTPYRTFQQKLSCTMRRDSIWQAVLSPSRVKNLSIEGDTFQQGYTLMEFTPILLHCFMG